MTDVQRDEYKTLNLYPIDYPFETLVQRLNTEPKKLILDPDFQRKYKWDKEGWERASLFIESCLMRIPLPSCYFAENENLQHLVIDGVQRLTTIQKFFNDEFALEGLTTFKELEGKKFSELGKFKSELESTTIRCIVLREENPKELIREIFSRLNQGAVQLTDQEIRHALYPGKLADLLEQLASHPIIAKFGLSVNSKKSKDSRESEEQVLRFLAFIDDPDLNNFEGTLKKFLDRYMDVHSKENDAWINKQKTKFDNAIENCVAVFGSDDIFTNLTLKHKRQGIVYYDLLMPTLGEINKSIVNSKKNEIRNAFIKLCNSGEFKRTISSGLQKKSAIKARKELWANMLNQAIQ